MFRGEDGWFRACVVCAGHGLRAEGRRLLWFRTEHAAHENVNQLVCAAACRSKGAARIGQKKRQRGGALRGGAAESAQRAAAGPDERVVKNGRQP